MIDWITASVPLSWEKPINDGKFIRVRPDGEIEWAVDRRRAVEGSFSSKIAVRTVKRGFVEVSGNPAKFLQGHNLFGTDDLRHLVRQFMEALCVKLDVMPTLQDRKAWINGDYELSRVDINYCFALRSRSDVRAWLRACSETARIKYKGRAQSEEGTLYFGKAKRGGRAKAWSMKLYCKADELGIRDLPRNADDWEAERRLSGSDPVEPLPIGTKHRPWNADRRQSRPDDVSGWGGSLPPDIPFRDELCRWADDKLRVELTLRTEELKRLDLRCANMWSETVVRETFAVYLSKLEIGEAVMVASSDVEKLPRALRRTYNEWQMGVDLRESLSRATFFRQRRAIMELLGVDIGVLQPKGTNVVPLRRAIVLGEAAPVPAWAPSSICVRAA